MEVPTDCNGRSSSPASDPAAARSYRVTRRRPSSTRRHVFDTSPRARSYGLRSIAVAFGILEGGSSHASPKVARVRVPPFYRCRPDWPPLPSPPPRCHFPAGVMQMTDLSPFSLRWQTSRCMSPPSTGMRFGRQRRRHWADFAGRKPGPLAFRRRRGMLQVIMEEGKNRKMENKKQGSVGRR